MVMSKYKTQPNVLFKQMCETLINDSEVHLVPYKNFHVTRVVVSRTNCHRNHCFFVC
jgi:hypothetical protein